MEVNKAIQEFYDEFKRVANSFQLTTNPLQYTNQGYGCRVFNKKLQSIFIIIHVDDKTIQTTVLDDDNPSLKDFIERLLSQLQNPLVEIEDLPPLLKKRKQAFDPISKNETDAIYLSTYGEDLYFGPQIAAAIFLSEETYQYFTERGFHNWTHCSTSEVSDIVDQLKERGANSIIRLGNESYNVVYERMGNISHIKAWTYTKLIENMKKQVNCSTFIIPPFDGSLLIQDLLISKGIEVEILHATPPEYLLGYHLSMCLAYISYIEEISRIEGHLGIEILYTNESTIFSTAFDFAKEFGIESLKKITKYHFDMTEKITEAIDAIDQDN